MVLGLAPIRIVVVRDPEGEFGDAYLFTTDVNADLSWVITTYARRWSSEGAHRRLIVHIAARRDALDLSQFSEMDVEQLRQNFADGISATRIAVTGGSITDTRGFAVAGDKQSALLDMTEIAKLLETNHGQAESFLAWEVNE